MCLFLDNVTPSKVDYNSAVTDPILPHILKVNYLTNKSELSDPYLSTHKFSWSTTPIVHCSILISKGC